MRKYLSLLTRLGLSPKESVIYLNLLEHGESSITQIVERTHLHRPEVYKYLPVLTQGGFVRMITRGKRRVFMAESPEHIRTLLNWLSEDIDQLLPEILSMYAQSEKRPHVRYLEWALGIQTLHDDVINTLGKGGIFYRIASERDPDHSNRYLSSTYRARRDGKELERYVIMSETGAALKRPRLERETVTIPPEFDNFADDVTMIIYAHKVGFIEYPSETTIIIENEFIAKFLESTFKILYSSLKSIRK